MKSSLLLVVLTCSLPSLQADEKPVIQGHVFGWPFLEAAEMQPRGGTTKGTKVVLDSKPSDAWKKLQQESKSAYAKDLKAILAMAGSYRVSFDFMETLGFGENYTPPKPYFSWGTEHVQVIAFEKDFVSLQHTLVMFFKDENGKESGPMVMKHWRQDWRYEDQNLVTYQGDSTWRQQNLDSNEVEAKWTQAVFQVDDSPRYEVTGHWSHEGGVSTWKTEDSWRPLPRREFSTRNDYNVLGGTHEITITPTGWVHVQQNRKLVVIKGTVKKTVGHELGINRYERISEPSLAAAETSWAKTSKYWDEVRKKWDEVFTDHQSFQLKGEVDGKKLYQEHFGYAMKLESSDGPYDAKAGQDHAAATIDKFLELQESDEADKKPSKY